MTHGVIMKLDLPRYKCTRFTLSCEGIAATTEDAAIQAFMGQTFTHFLGGLDNDSEDTRIAMFGSRRVIRGITHQVQAILARKEKDGNTTFDIGITIRKAPDVLSRPPREIKPISLFIEALPELFGCVDIEVSATFEYEDSDEKTSRFSFPMPLLVQAEGAGVTHIESAQFSRRENDEVKYNIAVVVPLDSRSFAHIVDFKSNSEINYTSIRKLFHESCSITTRFLI